MPCDPLAMDQSNSVEAARRFLSVVWDGDVPTDEALQEALDRLVSAYHETPEAGPDTELEAPRSDSSALYQQVAARFTDFGLYPVSDPAASIEDAGGMGDAIDHLLDLTLDMREVVWLADHAGLNDAHWSFRLLYFHWGRHARELSLYLHSRLFGWGCLLAIVHIWLPIRAKTAQYGIKWNMGARDEAQAPASPVAGRLERAQANFFETFPLMIAAVAIVSLADLETRTTAIGAWLWLGARVVYLPLYAFGVPMVRSVAWMAATVGILMVLTPALRAALGV